MLDILDFECHDDRGKLMEPQIVSSEVFLIGFVEYLYWGIFVVYIAVESHALYGFEVNVHSTVASVYLDLSQRSF